MRMKDLQILTHGPLLFTSDVRVSSERPYGDNTRWGDSSYYNTLLTHHLSAISQMGSGDQRPSSGGQWQVRVSSEFESRDEAGGGIAGQGSTAIRHAV